MAVIIGLQFRNGAKVYYFDPGELKLSAGQWCVVQTAQGIECGKVVYGNREVDDDKLVKPLKPVLRLADSADLKKIEANRKREKRAYNICKEQIKRQGLNMHLIEAECAFDENKILFYFTSDTRVDFRALVKELATMLRCRIELRQIGVRDECKKVGGLGICGRPFCCHSFMKDFHPVSIKMAKEQGLSLNPTKISGACGRLMCCLEHEQQAYSQLTKTLPRIGAKVQTPEGRGVVTETNPLRQTVKAKLEREDELATVRTFKVSEIRVLGSTSKDGAPAKAESAKN